MALGSTEPADLNPMAMRVRFRFCSLLLLLIGVGVPQLGAQERVNSTNSEPQLISIFPLGGPQGRAVEAEIRGTSLKGVYAAWFDAAGLYEFVEGRAQKRCPKRPLGLRTLPDCMPPRMTGDSCSP